MAEKENLMAQEWGTWVEYRLRRPGRMNSRALRTSGGWGSAFPRIADSLYSGTGEGRVHAGRCMAMVTTFKRSSSCSFNFLEEIGSKIMNWEYGWEWRGDMSNNCEKRGEKWVPSPEQAMLSPITGPHHMTTFPEKSVVLGDHTDPSSSSFSSPLSCPLLPDHPKQCRPKNYSLSYDDIYSSSWEAIKNYLFMHSFFFIMHTRF